MAVRQCGIIDLLNVSVGRLFFLKEQENSIRYEENSIRYEAAL